MNRLIMLMTISLLLLAGQLQSQTMTITGKVSSNLVGDPVPEVTVRLKGALTVVKTATDGSYTISVEQNSCKTLVFSYPDFD